MKARVALATLALVLTAVAPAAAGAPSPSTASAASTAQETDDLHRVVTLHLTPGDSGTVRAVVEYDMPSDLASLTVRPGTGNVTATDGFARTQDGLSWDEETATPSFTLSVDVNRTIGGARALGHELHATQESDGYAFVDVGEWALVPIPQFASQWSWYGSGTVTLSTETVVAGQGAVGGTMAYLGPQTTYTASGYDQTFRLVVPAAAELAESPASILNSFASASRTLQVGARDERVFVVAAPTSVAWGPAGLEYGGSDAWVLADSPLDVAGNVWLHEYVHTRQAYEPTAATKWTIEASAEYYAALLTLGQGRVEFDAFADHLRRGTRAPYASAVLADPSTWTFANYVKGPLVYGNVDRRIRLASDGENTAEDVLGLMNVDTDGSVTQSEFLAAVARAGGDPVATYANHYTETRDVPSMWSQREHANAFGSASPQLFASLPADGVHVTGPYRNVTRGTVPTLATGETLSVTVSVTNRGGEAGTFSSAILLNGSAVSTTRATVQPGATTTVTVSATLAEPGRYTLATGYETREFVVRDPATPNVSVSVNRTIVRPGGAVAVTLTATNPADYPAGATYTITTDETQAASWTSRLAPGESTEFRTTLTFEAIGAHTVHVGDRSFTIAVDESADTTPDRTDAPTAGSTPGFGVAAAVLAVLLVALGRRR